MRGDTCSSNLVTQVLKSSLPSMSSSLDILSIKGARPGPDASLWPQGPDTEELHPEERMP